MAANQSGIILSEYEKVTTSTLPSGGVPSCCITSDRFYIGPIVFDAATVYESRGRDSAKSTTYTF